MVRWYTADHHFGHHKVIEYCNRPFEHAHGMNVEMAQRWNALVGDGDEVWILGDLVWGSSWRAVWRGFGAERCSCPATTTGAGSAATTTPRAGPTISASAASTR